MAQKVVCLIDEEVSDVAGYDSSSGDIVGIFFTIAKGSRGIVDFDASGSMRIVFDSPVIASLRCSQYSQELPVEVYSAKIPMNDIKESNWAYIAN